MTLAERTRAAARAHPFLIEALRAGVCNYAAAARSLDVDGDEEAVATALRRFAADLPERSLGEREVRVRMEREGDPPLSVGGTAVDGDGTAILATGAVDGAALRAVLGHLAVADVSVEAAGVAADGGALVVVVGRRAGAAALRAVERALEGVPE